MSSLSVEIAPDCQQAKASTSKDNPLVGDNVLL
jgi:hypothetical protein